MDFQLFRGWLNLGNSALDQDRNAGSANEIKGSVKEAIGKSG
jgi:hypothetical protein